MPLVKLESVNKTYAQGTLKVCAVDDVDLQINKGEFTAIAGPSGSGKTTLLNLIGCLDTPTSGSILLDGLDLSKLDRNQLADIRRLKIGFIFQSYNLIPVLTAMENVEFALTLASRDSGRKKDVRNRVMNILAQVGLKGMENRRPRELSGGQQQRVAIARALVKEPAMILADEPTANLDSDTGKSVLELMEKMNQQHGTTFIFSTHDDMVMSFSRRLITLHDGRIDTDERGARHATDDQTCRT